MCYINNQITIYFPEVFSQLWSESELLFPYLFMHGCNIICHIPYFATDQAALEYIRL